MFARLGPQPFCKQDGIGAIVALGGIGEQGRTISFEAAKLTEFLDR